MKVLFVEDDPMNRRVVKAMLEVAGCQMDEAESGAAGVAMVEAEAYELILMDLRMPGMDGLTAIKHIRALGDAKGAAPIVVVTADTAPDLRADCLTAGANDFVMKPVSMTELFNVIAKVMVSNGA